MFTVPSHLPSPNNSQLLFSLSNRLSSRAPFLGFGPSGVDWLPGKTEAEAFLCRHVVSGREAEGALPHSAGGYGMVMARRDFQANCSGSNSASTPSLLCNLVGDFVPIPQSSSCKMGQGRCLLKGLLGGLYSFPLAVTRNYHKRGCLRQQKCILSQVCKPKSEIKMSVGPRSP